MPAPVVATTLAVLALLLPGCASRTTGPKDVATVHRTVTIALTDSLGAPQAGLSIWVTARFDSAGFAQLTSAHTDGSGEARFVLAEGPWAASANHPGTPGRAAGATWIVPGRTRPLADTVVVRLTLFTASTAAGAVALQGQSDHHGTFIYFEGPAVFSSTDYLGHWDAGGLPPGTWAFTAWHPGFGLGVGSLHVPGPGSTIWAGALVLQPEASAARPPRPALEGASTAAPYTP